jgi:hypothetical protein
MMLKEALSNMLDLADACRLPNALDSTRLEFVLPRDLPFTVSTGVLPTTLNS